METQGDGYKVYQVCFLLYFHLLQLKLCTYISHDLNTSLVDLWMTLFQDKSVII